MIRGPVEYVPPVEVEVVTKRKAIPLDENEGIYVRDVKTGKVRSIAGETYMLNQDEELWEKELAPGVEHLLSLERDPLADRNLRAKDGQASRVRDKTRVINFRVPHNAAVQIYDYKEKKARVIFGPELVMLGPDEQFTQLSLSGGKPKKPNQIRSLCLLLGPDFCTDIVTVETADHARLQLQLSYNWWVYLLVFYLSNNKLYVPIFPNFKQRSAIAIKCVCLFLLLGISMSKTRIILWRPLRSSVYPILWVMPAKPSHREFEELLPVFSLMTSTR